MSPRSVSPDIVPFDAPFEAAYLSRYPDVAKAVKNGSFASGKQHFMLFGASEGRVAESDTSLAKVSYDLIDECFYGMTYFKRQMRKAEASKHFIQSGWRKGFWPNNRFDTMFYLSQYGDVAKSGQNPLSHFVLHGADQARLPFGLRRLGKSVEAVDIVDLRGSTLVTQTFLASRNYLSSIVLPIGNYNNNNAGKIDIQVSTDTDVIFQSQFDGRIFSACEEFTLHFHPLEDSKGRQILISIKSAQSSDHGAAWPVYLGQNRGTFTLALEGKEAPPSARDCGLMIIDHYSPPQSKNRVPTKILYSPLTQCNLNCMHCISVHTRKTAHSIGVDVKTAIARWASEGLISQLIADYSGDILWSDHRTPGELDYIINLNVPFHIDTNGIYLDEARSTKLLGSRLGSLNVSLDAATTETFKRIRKGAPDLSLVIGNIQRFIELRNACTPQWTGTLSLAFTLMRSNLHELTSFVGLADNLGIRAIVGRHVECYTKNIVPESLWFDKERFNKIRQEALAAASEKGIDLYMPEPFSVRPAHNGRRFCPEPWYAAVLLGNGDVQVCCVPGTKIGNLNEESMESIWTGENYKQFRLSVNSESPPRPCQSCPMLRVENNPKSYFPLPAPDAPAPG